MKHIELKQKRIDNGISQRQMADKMHCHRHTVMRFETGKSYNQRILYCYETALNDLILEKAKS